MNYLVGDSRLINWPEFPLVRVVIFFMIGIILNSYLEIRLLYSFAISIATLITIVVLQKDRSSKLGVVRTNSFLLLVMFLGMGVIRAGIQNVKIDKHHFSNLISKDNYIVGQLIQDVKRKTSSSTLLSVRSVDGVPARGKLLVYFDKTEDISYKVGDIISVLGSASNIQNNNNPQAFDYRKHLAHKGIIKQVFLRIENHALIKHDRIFLPLHYAHKTRKWALAILKKRLKDQEQFATASAMVLGDRNNITPELQEAFSDTGAVHVLAVSGLHVGIVIMIFNLLFRRIRSKSNRFKVIKFITLTLVVITYALITGASPAVIRAAVMFITLLYGRLWFDNANIYNILAFSALAILMFDPFYLFQLGFVFSYLALVSIVFFQPYFMRFLERWYEPTNWFTLRLMQLITVSMAAQILIFPMSIFYFHKFPIYFILSGVMAVALAPFLLGLGLLLIFTDWVPILGDVIGNLFALLLDFFLAIIYGIQALPFNSVENVWISFSSMVVLYIGILSSMKLLSSDKTGYQEFLNNGKKARKISIGIIWASTFFLFINSTAFTHRVKNHNEMVFYDFKGSTLIDIFEGDNVYTIQSEDIDMSKMIYANRDYRIFHGNPQEKIMDLDSSFMLKTAIHKEGGLMMYGSKKILFAAKILEDKTFPQVSDILLLSHGTDLLPYRFLEVHTTGQVLIDDSIPSKLRNQWRKECQKRNIPVHILRQQGVIRLTTDGARF